MSQTTGRFADLELAVSAAVEAGTAVMRRFRTEHDVVHKSPDQPLTEADLEADAVLARVLRGACPEYGWLSEETVDRPDRLGARRVWIVDPIDGTRSYIEGYPEFAISVGLVDAGRAVVGVVYNPARSEMYMAVRGAGARVVKGMDGMDVGVWDRGERLRVRRESVEGQAVMLASRSEIAAGEFDPFDDEWVVEPVGSTTYKLARLAAGAGDVYLSRRPRHEWDVCAGALLVEEAGGRVTDVEGKPFRYNRPDPYLHGVLATNGRMHAYLVGIIESLPTPARLKRKDRNER